MNSRLLVKGLLCLIGTASVTTPVALRAAVPPETATATQKAKENADDSGNPYSVIVERNIFHLNPPPPPVEADKPKVDLPVIKITGFVNIGNQSKVLFVSQPKDKKEPIYYSLAEGETSDSGSHHFQLVKIHPAQEGVDVINDGTPVTLTVKDDSLLPTTTIAAAAPAAKGEPTPINPENGTDRRKMFQQSRPYTPGVPGAGLIPPRIPRGQQ
jgi:hypothetical protein